MGLDKSPKNPTFEMLSEKAGGNRQPYYKIMFFLNKKPDISDEDFHKHWEMVHADLTVATKAFRDVSILRYVQYHQTTEIKTEASSLGLTCLPYDGCTEMYVKDLNDWKSFTDSPEFKSVLASDSRRFIGQASVMVGYESVIYGDAIPSLGGKDGVSRSDL
ncbi:uncharacterized protein A1O9_06933 [Exophiala aquamarina CBS 119918]|uniref:EthD domain-containing protein n=1 Tax=Exophiala aquamarina CBS 119918 TaxID=1182545 RepID=A0A072PBV2_9EURO|nr:uncharacterized protein A1O9_06933 [Exophiala aquamarina CBS 119918]KEF56743.1 hypothetical protein A1O9_06933 [Exophiala aquamarina CBS 119918]